MIEYLRLAAPPCYGSYFTIFLAALATIILIMNTVLFLAIRKYVSMTKEEAILIFMSAIIIEILFYFTAGPLIWNAFLLQYNYFMAHFILELIFCGSIAILYVIIYAFIRKRYKDTISHQSEPPP